MGEHILITGLSGAVGQAIWPQLKEFFLSGKSPYASPSLMWLKNERSFNDNDIQPCTIDKVTDGLDLIIHLAGKNVAYSRDNEKDAWKVNVELTNTLSGKLSDTGRIIFTSSEHVFSGKSLGEHYEHTKMDPQSVYGKQKAVAEGCVLQTSGRRGYIVRLATVMNTNPCAFTDSYFAALQGDQKFSFWDNVPVKPVLAEDVANAIIAVIKYTGREHVFHAACQGEPLTYHQIALKIATIAKEWGYITEIPQFKFGPASEEVLETRPRKYDLNVTLTQSELDIKFQTIDTALRKVVIEHYSKMF